MSKTFKLLGTRLRLAADEALSSLQTTTISIPEAVQKGIDAFRMELTTVVYLTGAAMSPTLVSSSKQTPDDDSVTRLLMRWIPRPSSRTINVGDVVALKSPLSLGSTETVLIRRVAAIEGEEMVPMVEENVEENIDASGAATATAVSSWVIPQGSCWVLADNEALSSHEVIDSRSFGPLQLQNIMGRIMYFAHSKTEHGYVENSSTSMQEDEPVLEAELNVDKMLEDE